MPEFEKKRPILLTLAEYRIVESLINEYEEEEITPEERKLRSKVRRIIWCIERAREYKAKNPTRIINDLEVVVREKHGGDEINQRFNDNNERINEKLNR